MNVIITTVMGLILSFNQFVGHVLHHKTKTSSKSTSSRKISSSSSVPTVDVETEAQNLADKAPKLNKDVLKLALTAYNKVDEQGMVKKPLLTVIDYSLPSNQQRMWIFNVEKNNLLYNTYVAHGKNSGVKNASRFSNEDSSKESSLGTYVTEDTYMGHKGLSLNINGLDKGFNDNALSRRVVVHGAWYVEPSFIQKEGRAGLSWGCPAIAQSMAIPVINTIKEGSVIFSYYPDKNFLNHSGYLMT